MIKDIIHSMKDYPKLKEKYEGLESEFLQLNYEKESLNNQIKLKDKEIKKIYNKYLETEEKRRNSASKAGGLRTSLNKSYRDKEKLSNMVNELTDKLNDLTNKINEARILIQSLNKEIRRLKTKPDLTMENLRKYERTRKSPRKEIIE